MSVIHKNTLSLWDLTGLKANNYPTSQQESPDTNPPFSNASWVSSSCLKHTTWLSDSSTCSDRITVNYPVLLWEPPMVIEEKNIYHLNDSQIKRTANRNSDFSDIREDFPLKRTQRRGQPSPQWSRHGSTALSWPTFLFRQNITALTCKAHTDKTLRLLWHTCQEFNHHRNGLITKLSLS